MPYVICAIFILIVILVLVIVFNYLKIKDIHDIITSCTTNIEEVLEKKKKVLLKLIEKVPNVKNEYSFDDNEDVYTLDEMLFNIAWDINNNLTDTLRKKLKKQLKELKSIEEELEGLKDFYNVKMNTYNSLYNKKPFTLVYKILKLYPGRLFNLKKIEKYEILKN